MNRLGPCRRKRLRMHQKREFSQVFPRVPGHVPGKWCKICLRDSAILCLNNKNLHCWLRTWLRTQIAGCKISGQQPTKLQKKFPRIHEVGHSQKTMLTCFGTNCRVEHWGELNTEARQHRNRHRGRIYSLTGTIHSGLKPQVNLLICSTHLMSIRPTMQEAWERLKKARSLCVVCCLLGMFRNRQCRLHPMFLHFHVEIKHIIWQTFFICPFKHAAGGVICQGASMLPTPYRDGCRFQLLFETVLPTHNLQLVSLSVSCRLLSRNSVQTNKELSLEQVGFFRHICFLGGWKNLVFLSIRAMELSYVYFWSAATLLTGFFHSRKNNSRCLKNALAFSGPNQAHNLTNILHMSFQACCWRGHLPGCFSAPHFLLTRVPFSTPLPNSLAYIQLAACLLISVLPAAFKKFCSNKQGTVTGTSWIS